MDEILGIAPPIAIKQKNTTRNPRSTVATSTEFYDFLAAAVRARGPYLLSEMRRPRPCATRWTRSPPRCWLKQPEARGGTRCFRYSTARPRRHFAIIFSICRAKGFNRLFQDGRIVRVLDAGIAARHRFHASRCARWSTALPIVADLHQRIVDTVEICYREAGRSCLRARPAGQGQASVQREVRLQDAAVSSSASRSRDCSASTILLAPARAARASGIPSTMTWTW